MSYEWERNWKADQFVRGRFSLISGIKDVAEKLQVKSGERGIDFLVQTQGT